MSGHLSMLRCRINSIGMEIGVRTGELSNQFVVDFPAFSYLAE